MPMRHAVMSVRETSRLSNSKRSMLLDFYWNWVAVGQAVQRWSCPPGLLGASNGYWRDHPLTNDIKLYDDDDKFLAWVWDAKVPYIGYPFDGLAGSTGDFTVMTQQGGALDHFCVWRLLIEG